ncbi:hypothetical protein J7E38_11110 [Bacillus sp. ISL-35]|uniref:hypothetical protein n=1 Tax=Bacillus sp. ISL-35 TaxID=2819122 RepID=UPI001BE65CF1|nr:hypothetical protein [Bacillus sp. ISL-35]MBT2679554.1 hypothetical protein [Bacillus sp. ISL-35]MBT2703457.1 hypothetical protein [Chryseobacterium sp. ISL-80]
MKFIEIKLTKHSIYLTEEEIRRLLSNQPEVYTEGIKRGKAFKRSNQLKERIKNKHNEEIN